MDFAAYGKLAYAVLTKPLAIGIVASAACLPIAKFATWGSRKVSDVLDNYDQKSWKHTALKIGSRFLLAVGVLATAGAIAGVGCTVAFTVSFVVTSLSGLPAAGIAAGIVSGMAASAIVFKQFLNCIYHPDSIEIDLEWLAKMDQSHIQYQKMA